MAGTGRPRDQWDGGLSPQCFFYTFMWRFRFNRWLMFIDILECTKHSVEHFAFIIMFDYQSPAMFLYIRRICSIRKMSTLSKLDPKLGSLSSKHCTHICTIAPGPQLWEHSSFLHIPLTKSS